MKSGKVLICRKFGQVTEVFIKVVTSLHIGVHTLKIQKWKIIERPKNSLVSGFSLWTMEQIWNKANDGYLEKLILVAIKWVFL